MTDTIIIPLAVPPDTKCDYCGLGEGDDTFSMLNGVTYGDPHPVPAPTVRRVEFLSDGREIVTWWHVGCDAQVQYDRAELMMNR